MNLDFPPLNGGPESGINDAGIETFEGDFAKNVIRECAQNSLDAAADPGKPISLHIKTFFIKKEELPFLTDLRQVLEACRDHWINHEKAKKFFAAALKLTAENEILALKISDFGTTGVDGDDTDKNGRWFGLVKSRGVSNQKGAESAGAFGIGKDAPLAGSAFRLVIYSTRTRDGHVALQGVCRLVSHKDSKDVTTQGTGFIGGFDPSQTLYTAIRDPEKIPTRFRRQEPGLDVWIMGLRHWNPDWVQPYVRSALANFWPAIADRKISFLIGESEINHSNLGEWMKTERGDMDVENVWPFYLALVDRHAKKFEQDLPTAGKCRLHLLLARRDLPKQICMVRRTGMVIEQYNPRVGFLPFSGLFVCEGTEGNRLLRTLEPPRHDKWDITRAEDKAAETALKEIREWIRNTIREQTPHASDDQFNETEVPPDLLEDVPENPFTEPTNEDAEPDLGGKPKEAITTERVIVRPKPMRKTAQPGDSGTSGGEGNVDDPIGGDGKNTGGAKKQKGEGMGNESFEPKKPTMHFRAFFPADMDGVHEIVMRCDADYNGDVRLNAVDEDGTAEAVFLESAEIVGRGASEIEDNRIKKIAFKKGEAVRAQVRLKSKIKYSVKAALV